MRKTWRLQNGSNTFLIIRRSDLKKDEKIIDEPLKISSNFNRWLNNTSSRMVLLDIYSSLSTGLSFKSGRLSDNDIQRFIRPQIESAFHRGDFILLNMEKPRLYSKSVSDNGSMQTIQDEPKKNRTVNDNKSSWIEIELVDESGIPVASAKYRITLPDGLIKEGRLNSQGFIRIDDIKPGNCKISFPEIDAETWN